jgi:hypothetical protein
MQFAPTTSPKRFARLSLLQTFGYDDALSLELLSPLANWQKRNQKSAKSLMIHGSVPQTLQTIFPYL